MIVIDISLLISSHDFARVGMRVVEDNYRYYQAHVQEMGVHHSGTREAESRFRGAVETLREQIAEILGFSQDDVDVNLRGHLYRYCGWPLSPKGLDEFRHGNPPKYATLPEGTHP